MERQTLLQGRRMYRATARRTDRIHSQAFPEDNQKGVTHTHVMEGSFEFYENDAKDMNRYKDQLPVDINLFYSTIGF